MVDTRIDTELPLSSYEGKALIVRSRDGWYFQAVYQQEDFRIFGPTTASGPNGAIALLELQIRELANDRIYVGRIPTKKHVT